MSEKKHTSFSDKIKGAARVVHGIGENIRGSVMGAVESASGSEEGKTKEENIVNKGRSEIEKGLAQIKGQAVPAASGGETGETAEGTETQTSEAVKPEDKPQPATTATPQRTTGTGDVPPQLPLGTTPQAQGAVAADEPKSRQTLPDTIGQKQTGQIETENVQSGQDTQLASATKPSQMGDQSLVGQGADAPQGPGSSV